MLKQSELVERHAILNGERLRILKLEVSQGVIGIPIAVGPQLLCDGPGAGDVVVDTILIRHASYDDGTPEPCDLIALVVGIGCAQAVDRMVAMAGEKLRLVGGSAVGQVRISRTGEGWQIAGWPRPVGQAIGGGGGRSGGRRRTTRRGIGSGGR